MPVANAFQIIGSIKKVLFAAEDRRFQAWIDKICTQNKEAIRYTDPGQPLGFMYSGLFFIPSWSPPGVPKKKSLHLSLYAEMDSFLRDRKIIDDDKAFISQVLYMLISPCQNQQDFRDTLPECLVQLLPDLSRLPRTREAAFTISNNERALKQYQKMLPRIETYTAAKLIY